jgi:ABC-type glycerol-3-phosphate transport system substrate-binding protein
MKKLITFILILSFILTLAACGTSNSKSNDNRITVTLAAPLNAYIENFDTNLYKLWFEQQSGLDIEMIWLPAEDAERIAMIALSTGEDLPCAFVGFGSS